MTNLTLQKTCNSNPCVIQMSNDEIYYLSNFEPDEIQVNTSITFISPSNIINEDEYYINDQSYNLSFSGDYINNSLYISNFITDLVSINQGEFSYDTNQCLYKNRLLLQNSQNFSIMSKSSKFCKVFGFIQGVTYQSVLNTKTNKYEIKAPNKMYTLNYKQIKIQCFELEDYNFIEFGKQCKYILKDAYFSYVNSSGQLVTIQSQFPSIFKTSQFTKDLYLNIVDETSQPIQFEDPFRMTFQITTSQRLIQKRLTESENQLSQKEKDDQEKQQQLQVQQEQQQQLLQAQQAQAKNQYDYYLQVYLQNIQIINDLRSKLYTEDDNLEKLVNNFQNVQFNPQYQIQDKIVLLQQIIQIQQALIKLLQELIDQQNVDKGNHTFQPPPPPNEFQEEKPILQNEEQQDQNPKQELNIPNDKTNEDYFDQSDIYKLIQDIHLKLNEIEQNNLDQHQDNIKMYIESLPLKLQPIATKIIQMQMDKMNYQKSDNSQFPITDQLSKSILSQSLDPESDSLINSVQSLIQENHSKGINDQQIKQEIQLRLLDNLKQQFKDFNPEQLLQNLKNINNIQDLQKYIQQQQIDKSFYKRLETYSLLLKDTI